MFEADKGNANVERNDGVILDSDYDSNSVWKATGPAALLIVELSKYRQASSSIKLCINFNFHI